MLEKRHDRELSKVMQEFVIPNCWLQIQAEVIKRGGMAIPYLLSKPGAGKTTIMKKMCSDNNFGSFVLHPALTPIEEWGGLPNFKTITINDQEFPGTEWTISQTIVELHKLAANHKMTVMLWDDMHLCGQQHLSLMQEAFSERSIRGYKLPDNVALVLAGNDSNKAGHKSLSSAISNRCARCYVYTNYESWKNNFAVGNNIHPAVISFLGNNMYSKFFHEDEIVDEPWASPRSWSRFSNYIQAMESWNKKQLDASMVSYYGSSHIGYDAGNEFGKYYHVFMKFDCKSYLTNYKSFKLPDDEIEHYPLAFAMVYYYGGLDPNVQKENIKNITHIISVFYDESKALSLLLFKELLNIEKAHGKNIIKPIVEIAQKDHNNMVMDLIDAVDNINDN